MFSHFVDWFLIFENFGICGPKTEILAKQFFCFCFFVCLFVCFFGFFVKIFKNKKLIKKESEKTFPRYTYLDGFGDFCQKIYFFTLVKKKFGSKNHFFGDFSKKKNDF